MTDLRDQLEASLELETLRDEVKRLREALEQICANADRIRQLEDADIYRDGLKEGYSRARTIAWKALNHD